MFLFACSWTRNERNCKSNGRNSKEGKEGRLEARKIRKGFLPKMCPFRTYVPVCDASVDASPYIYNRAKVVCLFVVDTPIISRLSSEKYINFGINR